MEDAGKCLIEQKVKPFTGPVVIVNALLAPHNRIWDLDNFNKPILDCLRRNGIIEDDNYRIVRKITAEVGDTVGAVVTIKTA